MNPENLTLLEASNLPDGSVIEESLRLAGDLPAALTKQDDGKWTCDLCDDPHRLSSIYRSDHTYSLESLGELPEGFVFGSANLELSKFAPEGTLVSDKHNDGAAWEKIGNEWVIGFTHENRALMAEDLSQIRLEPGRSQALSSTWAPYTVIAPEKEAENEEGLSAEDATGLRDKVLKDREGDLWRFHDGEWQFDAGKTGWTPLSSRPYELDEDFEPFTIHANPAELSAVEAEKLTDRVFRDRTGDLWKMIDGRWKFSVDGIIFTPFRSVRAGGLPPMGEPYEVVGFAVEDLLKRPDRLYYDADGDLWGCRDGMWSWGRDPENLEYKMSGGGLRHFEPFDDVEPYRVAEGVSLPETEPEPKPEEERAPTITETWPSIAASLERIANALEEK